MIVHIVMWRLHPEAAGRDKAENARLIKQGLDALAGQVPGLLAIRVGIDMGSGADAADLVLYSEFADRAALEAYHHHPLHEAVRPLVQAARCERRVVDFEV